MLDAVRVGPALNGFKQAGGFDIVGAQVERSLGEILRHLEVTAEMSRSCVRQHRFDTAIDIFFGMPDVLDSIQCFFVRVIDQENPRPRVDRAGVVISRRRSAAPRKEVADHRVGIARVDLCLVRLRGRHGRAGLEEAFGRLFVIVRLGWRFHQRLRGGLRVRLWLCDSRSRDMSWWRAGRNLHRWLGC